MVKICLIEKDDGLRRAIYRHFRNANLRVEPYQDFDEFEEWNSPDSVIACGAEGLIDQSIPTRAAALRHHASSVSRHRPRTVLGCGDIKRRAIAECRGQTLMSVVVVRVGVRANVHLA